MRRAVHFAVLALLLLFMQHQGYVHPIAHLAGKTLPSQETALSAPQASADCVECALLASGCNVVPTAGLPTAAGERPAGLVFHSYHSRAGEVPAWFQSRAPPILL